MSAISLAMAACAIRDRDRYEVAGSTCREARAPTKARPTQGANSRLEMVSPGAEPVAAPEKARVRTGQTFRERLRGTSSFTWAYALRLVDEPPRHPLILLQLGT